MRIVVLAENTAGNTQCGAEHGLCLYIETKAHRLLFDTGASDLFLKNAEVLHIDLNTVDTVILSHGHYDHGGGLPYFLKYNDHATIYVPKDAFGPYYSMHSAGPKYIGLPEGLEHDPRLIICGRDMDIDEELHLFSDIPMIYPIPSANARLKVKKGDAFIADDFRHEQCLMIKENGARYLFSGCAHHGIRNILERFRTLYTGDPDAVFGGFHMMKRSYEPADIEQILETARALKQYRPQFYTCHCTGTEAYEKMKTVMGEQLHVLHCGDTLSFE